MKSKLPLVVTFCLLLAAVPGLLLLLPQKDFSEKEKRYLQSPPVFTADQVLQGEFMEDAEKYLADHFPGREGLVGLWNYFSLYTGRNGQNGVYLGKNNWLFPTPVESDPKDFEKNLAAIRDFSEKADRPVALLAVPSAGSVYPALLPDLHADYPDQTLLSQAQDFLSPYVEWLSISSSLESHTEEGVFYRTDHHWTSLGAYLAYTAFMEAKGRTPLPASAFEKERYNGFYGTSYSKSGLWGVPPDTIEVWKNPALRVQVTVYDENKSQPVESDNPFFTEHLDEQDKYSVFLDGNHSLVRIENPTAEGGRLLLVKDSFAHCLAPFLAAHYSRIDMIDLRYFKGQSVEAYMAEHNFDQILLVYGLDSLATDKSLRWLAR